MSQRALVSENVLMPANDVRWHVITIPLNGLEMTTLRRAIEVAAVARHWHSMGMCLRKCHSWRWLTSSRSCFHRVADGWFDVEHGREQKQKTKKKEREKERMEKLNSAALQWIRRHTGNLLAFLCITNCRVFFFLSFFNQRTNPSGSFVFHRLLSLKSNYMYVVHAHEHYYSSIGAAQSMCDAVELRCNRKCICIGKMRQSIATAILWSFTT